VLDRRERVLNEEETTRLFLRALQTRIWTALVCQVVKFYADEMTVDCQPVVNAQMTDPAGDQFDLPLPLLPHVPCQFPGGGGATLTWTPVAGDECLVVFSSRNIDNWWTTGYQTPNAVNALGQPYHAANTPGRRRMHNLSDGVALLGLRNKTRAYAPATAGIQLQSDDGEAYVQLDPTLHSVNIVASGGVNINGATIDANGHVTGVGTAGDVRLDTHTHGGVQTGGGISGPPTEPS
jgi:hypothetical protein